MNWRTYGWNGIGYYISGIISATTGIFTYTNLVKGVDIQFAIMAVFIGGLGALSPIIIMAFTEKGNESKAKSGR